MCGHYIQPNEQLTCPHSIKRTAASAPDLARDAEIARLKAAVAAERELSEALSTLLMYYRLRKIAPNKVVDRVAAARAAVEGTREPHD